MRGFAAFAVAWWTFAVPASAGSVSRLDGDLVAVRAQGVPLGQLLKELAALAPLEVESTEPRFLLQPVDVTLDRVPLDQAAARILVETGLSFAVGGLKGQPLRVIVGSSDLSAMRPGAPPPRPEGEAPRAPVEAGSPGAENADLGDELAADREQMRAEQEAREQASLAQSAIEREAEQLPQTVWDDPGVPGGYTMVGESVTYHDPSFVPFKNRPEVRARRLATDVSQIP